MAKSKRAQRLKRTRGRIRSKITGTNDRPRLCVFRSNRHIYVQVIDDLNGHTLASASSKEAETKKGDKPVDVGLAVGQLVAERAKEKGIETVVFDRNVYRHHGRVRAVAEGARKGGLTF